MKCYWKVRQGNKPQDEETRKKYKVSITLMKYYNLQFKKNEHVERE